MNLAPSDAEKLLMAVAEMTARDRLARGVKLNYPESVALLSTWVVERARDGIGVEELMQSGREVLTRAQVMVGVAEMITDVQTRTPASSTRPVSSTRTGSGPSRGACPHTAIRGDVSQNLLAVEDLEHDFTPVDVVLVESGGDNLTATFSPALVDAQFFVLGVAGGGDVARKGGPGIAGADVLVVNKTDLAPYVGVDVEQMVADASAARDGRTVIALSRTDLTSVARVRQWVLAGVRVVDSLLQLGRGAREGGSTSPDGPETCRGYFSARADVVTYELLDEGSTLTRFLGTSPAESPLS